MANTVRSRAPVTAHHDHVVLPITNNVALITKVHNNHNVLPSTNIVGDDNDKIMSTNVSAASSVLVSSPAVRNDNYKHEHSSRALMGGDGANKCIVGPNNVKIRNHPYAETLDVTGSMQCTAAYGHCCHNGVASVKHLGGPLSPLCITDTNHHEIIKPKPRRELRLLKPTKVAKRKTSRPCLANSSLLNQFNENFILKRSIASTVKSFQPQSLRSSEMCQQRNEGQMYDFCKRDTRTPSPTTITELPASEQDDDESLRGKNVTTNHKVVIYFGDSLSFRGKNSLSQPPISEPKPLTKQNLQSIDNKIYMQTTSDSSNITTATESIDSLTPFIECLDDGVINIRIKGNYKTASALVKKISQPTQVETETFQVQNEHNENENWSESDNKEACDFSDWTFVQEWRARPTADNGRHNTAVFETHKPDELPSHGNNKSIEEWASHAKHNVVNVGQHSSMAITSTVRLQNSTSYLNSTNADSSNNCESRTKPIPPYRGLSTTTNLSGQGVPMKLRPPTLNTAIDLTPHNLSFTHKNSNYNPTSIGIPIDVNYVQGAIVPTIKDNSATRTHHHEFRALERVQECNSSSDENRSSGHASMSDTGGHGSSSPSVGVTLGPLPEDRLAAGVMNRSTRSRANGNHTRARHRAIPAKTPWGGSGLDDIKMAIQQLTMRSQTSTSTYSSLSAGSESSEPVRRLGRYASMETVNTNITSADEFVWVDSHNRLMELQQPPWTQQSILSVLRNGRCKDHADRISNDAISRLSYLLQRAFVRIAKEVQRLSSNLGVCTKQEVASAFKIILSAALADSCLKACFRAAAMFAVPGDTGLKQSKSSRAGLHLPIGRIHRWMIDARFAKFVHEYAAIYLSAGIENLLEDILLQSLPGESSTQLTATVLEHAISISGDLWSLLQPYAHLNAGRIASGALSMSSRGSNSTQNTDTLQSGLLVGNGKNNIKLEPCLLTTCVGSMIELRELILRTQNIVISCSGLSALFYFMRCSQLEHRESTCQQGAIGGNGVGINQNVQELGYERAYVILPPLLEWLRVASANADYRNAKVIDRDDIMQASRLLLPGVDCPVRSIGHDEELPAKKVHFSSSTTCGNKDDILELGNQATIALAFKLMLTGRAELLVQASNLLPPTTRYNTLNHAGMTALMIASTRNDEVVLQALLNAGCDVNIEVPSLGNANYPAIHPDTQHWTAVTFAAAKGNYVALHILLERGGNVEGGARPCEDKQTLTPLQVACASGNVEIVSLLLAHGANAFLSTQQKDSMSFAGSAQRGCYCAIAVASAHGQRSILRKLLSSPINPISKEVLSLEEMLAEGDFSTGCTGTTPDSLPPGEVAPKFNKSQIKSLQEAMYHSTENNHLDITIELRTLGVPWTLHCWMYALAAAHELRFDVVIDQLLQDFLQVCPDDYSSQFVTECLPLLFNIFRFSKNEGTTLLLADIFTTCFGREQIKSIKEPPQQPINGSRIDPRFVNNRELSDVHFRVEGKIFYGHKIVLITASPRFKNMLTTKLSENGGIPVVQINDIRYNIFQLVMVYLYSGGSNTLDISESDILELMAAASFFQLDGLLCSMEARCSEMINIDNVVAMYIHAKVYNANKLLEFCQGFLLQNMVALLTYDDSVKRLLFAKKIPNHDVLLGLLHTLQQRIKERKSPAAGNLRHHLKSPLPDSFLSTSLAYTSINISSANVGPNKK